MNRLLSYKAPNTERTNEFHEKENFELAVPTETHISLSCTNMLKTKNTTQNLRHKNMGGKTRVSEFYDTILRNGTSSRFSPRSSTLHRLPMTLEINKSDLREAKSFPQDPSSSMNIMHHIDQTPIFQFKYFHGSPPRL